MPSAFLFADEAGDFKFHDGDNISRYFILCTMRITSCEIGADLLNLRRRMLLDGIELTDKFHASADSPFVREQVYEVIQKHDFRIDATLLEKRKARPYTRPDEPTFYKYAWFYHAKFIVPHRVNRDHDLLVSAAALETKRGKAAFKNVFNNVIQQTATGSRWATDFPASAADPCLQAADYCAWAIQRKWERNDRAAYDPIADRIATEFDLWRSSNEYYF